MPFYPPEWKNMQTKLLATAVFSLGLLAGGAASAAETVRGQAKLATPVSTVATTTINKVDWRCEADACVGTSASAPGLDGFMKECRKVAAALGPLAGYSSRGRTMSDNEIQNCNTAAKTAAVAEAKN
jgi:hypothetical protein